MHLAAVRFLGLCLFLLVCSPALRGWAAAAQAADANARPTIVVVPGVTGSKLVDRATGDSIWGSSSRVFLPKDRGHSSVLPLAPREAARDSIVATELLFELKLFGFTKPIYGPLVSALIDAGNRLGELSAPTTQANLYLFAYDWRHTNLSAVSSLHHHLLSLSEVRESSPIHLVCQSNAARICRYLVKYQDRSLEAARAMVRGDSSQSSSPGYQVEKMILVGTSNGGALRQLQELHRGRRYVPGVGRYVGPESLFAIRPLFDDLPIYTEDLFFDESGQPIAVDVFDAANWRRYQWSIFAPEVQRVVDHPKRRARFGTQAERFSYLQRRLEEAREQHDLLRTDSPSFPEIAIYLLENDSQATAVRALLRRQGDGWQTLFLEDSQLARNSAWRSRASESGDGHATLVSQRYLSPQERSALKASACVRGGHFDTIVEPETHRWVLEFLDREEAPRAAAEIDQAVGASDGCGA